jgi:hypothetical protein
MTAEGQLLRPLREEEKALLNALLPSFYHKLSTCFVEDMNDGGMGSIRFSSPSDNKGRSLGKILAEARYTDSDGVEVSIVVNADKAGEIYELDIWKVDFSPLRAYPAPQNLKIT